MTRPWNETLESDARGNAWIKGSLAALRHTMPGGHSLTPSEVEAWGRMFSAAPDMARALVAALREGGNASWMDGNERKTLHGVIRAALTKAGVPLP